MKALMNYSVIQSRLIDGQIGVMPTDTIYGLVGQALKTNLIERAYKIKQRDQSKPLIVLIGNVNQLADLGIELNDTDMAVLDDVWPGPTSVILKCADPEKRFLHRGTWTLAVRLPALESLHNLIKATGPLIATSSNIEDQPPATTIEEARAQFGDTVDFYLDGGLIEAKPSRLIKIENGQVIELRS